MAGRGRLPQPLPIPTRPDEFWRPELEPNMEAIPFGDYCSHREGARWDCHREAVARAVRGRLYLCHEHLRAANMWIEDGRVVSWFLSR